MNEYEWIYDWTLMLSKGYREPLLSFELIYFRTSFCYRIENSWSFRYKILDHVGHLGKSLNFFVSLGIADVLGFSELPVYTDVVLLKTFPQHFELCLHCKYWRSYEVLQSRWQNFWNGLYFFHSWPLIHYTVIWSAAVRYLIYSARESRHWAKRNVHYFLNCARWTSLALEIVFFCYQQN